MAEQQRRAGSKNGGKTKSGKKPPNKPIAPFPFMFELQKEICSYYLDWIKKNKYTDKGPVGALAQDIGIAWGHLHAERCELKKELEVEKSDRTLQRYREAISQEHVSVLEGVLTNNLAQAIDRLLDGRKPMSAEDIGDALRKEGNVALLCAERLRAQKKGPKYFLGGRPIDVGLAAAIAHGFVKPAKKKDGHQLYRATTGQLLQKHKDISTLWGVIATNTRFFLGIAAREFDETYSQQFRDQWSREMQSRATYNRTSSFRFRVPRSMRPEEITDLCLCAMDEALEKLEKSLRRKHRGERYLVDCVLGISHGAIKNTDPT